MQTPLKNYHEHSIIQCVIFIGFRFIQNAVLSDLFPHSPVLSMCVIYFKTPHAFG